MTLRIKPIGVVWIESHGMGHTLCDILVCFAYDVVELIKTLNEAKNLSHTP